MSLPNWPDSVRTISFYMETKIKSTLELYIPMSILCFYFVSTQGTSTKIITLDHTHKPLDQESPKTCSWVHCCLQKGFSLPIRI
jgi:hypothetical protein